MAAGDWFVARTGYTGEDGFEISVPLEAVEGFARALLEHPAVAPIGLGARDTLRLEVRNALYGHELTDETSPFAPRRGEFDPATRVQELNPVLDALKEMLAE